jgi:hypothetical protein
MGPQKIKICTELPRTENRLTEATHRLPILATMQGSHDNLSNDTVRKSENLKQNEVIVCKMLT